MEGTYRLYTYLPEMRDAMEKWEAFVKSIRIDTPRRASRLSASDPGNRNPD
jgi:hypothetical protein